MGSGAGGNRLLNLLVARIPERKTRCTIQAFEVPPRKGGRGKPTDHDGFAEKAPRQRKPRGKKEPLVHLLIRPASIDTRKEMGKGVPGDSPERWGKGRNLPIGKIGSRVGKIDSERPKGQGRKYRSQGWIALPKEPTLGTRRNSTPDLGIRARHQGSRSHGPGQNHQAHPTKLLVTQDEQTYHRLHQKLPGMPVEQSLSTPTSQTVLTAGTPICSLAVNRYGLHYGTPICSLAVNRYGLHYGTPSIGRMQSALGNHRPIHQDGTLPPTKEGRENSSQPSSHICLRNMEAPWTHH